MCRDISLIFKRMSPHCFFSLPLAHAKNIDKTHLRKIMFLSNLRVKITHYKNYRALYFEDRHYIVLSLNNLIAISIYKLFVFKSNIKLNKIMKKVFYT